MSPWKVLGWLLVALLCLLLTAGAYGLALLWGWSLPSVWWLAAIAGAGAGVALIIFLFRTMRDDTHEPAAPLPVELPSERLPRWLLLDGGGLFPHLPGILENAGRPLLSDGAAENAGSVGLWSTAHAHWIAVDFSAPHLSGERKGDGGEGNTPDKAPSLPLWDQLLDDKAVRRWLSPPAGVVLCIGAESLSGHGDDTAAFMRQRLLTVRNRLGNAPVCLLVTGLEHAPGLSRLARHFTAEISIGRNALHAPLGWFMPVRRPWTPMPRWAADGVREGMNGLTAALDSLVRCSESGIPAPGGPAFLLEGALRQLASPLASFAAALGDGLGGIFWAASPPAPSAFQQATRLSPVMKDAPPYRSPLLGIRILFGSRRCTSCNFSGQPALRDRSSRLPVHALIRDCGTSPVRTGAPPRNIASLCPSSHRTAGTAAGRLLDRRNPLCRHRRGCAVPWRGTFPNPSAGHDPV